ncbi:MAG: hypothetical protein HY960_04235 [Ignavibacteriae bacterium]|nr:hypothetical protein [Ignavibacteriota bacterium]
MDEKKKHIKDESSVSKLLKDLPRVKASPDFEARLHRRIVSSKEESERKSLFDILFFPRRVPVFATSILALLAVSVISYVVFMKNRDESASTTPQHPTIAESSEPQPPNQADGRAVEQESNQLETSQDILVRKDEEIKSKKETVFPALKLQEKATQVAPEVAGRSREPNIESDEQAAVSVQDNAEKGVVAQEELEKKAVQQNIEMQAAEPAQEIQMKMTQPLQQLQKMKNTTEKFPLTEFAAEPQKVKGGRSRDSIRIADSLRIDSIQKALQKKLLQQKQKIKPE